MIRYPLWGALVSLLLWTGSLTAQRPVPLDTLRVTTSSRASAEMATATRAVEVITAAQIRRLPARSVAEVLQWALGVDLMPRSPALFDVAVRGSSFEQVLVLVDGIRMSDAQTGHFDLNLAVPLDQVERIEILRGPASTLHGADAVGR
jgi:iron complex outermembrane receptor protein